MLMKEVSTEQLAEIMREDDWLCNSDMYRDGDQQPDFHDEEEFPRSTFLEHWDVTDEDEVPDELLEKLED